MNILIVDDREDSRYLLESLLRGNGHAVQAAANGAEALVRLAAGGIELIISDVLMPVMDGFQLCRKVKADPSLPGIPFIIYTATYTGPQDESFALQIGADRFIEKPCEPDVLLAALGEVIDAGRRGGSALAPAPLPEEDVLKLYNERLVRKLESKMLQAEQEIQMRQEAEKALRERERRLSAILATIQDGFWMQDAQGRLTDVNEAYCRMSGYTREEILRLAIFDLDTDALPPGATQRLARIRAGEAELFEARHRRKDGSVFDMEVSATWLPIDEQFVCLCRDITKRRQAEAERERLQGQLAQSQKMESVGRLAGGVAHDFNNMLSVILGCAELALGKVDPAGPLHADLTEILNAAKRSTDITRQLLAFARKQTISPKVLDVNEVVEAMLKMLRRLIGEDIDLRWRPGSPLWPVKIDPTQIEQVLANLCVNARDAIAGVGTVTIETRQTAFDEAYCAAHPGFLRGEFVLLEVNDDGCGMDDKTLDNIFEPFFTTKEGQQGIGLGLATVYGIVKQNNGFFNVRSAKGNGTTFRIYWPRYFGQAERIGTQTTAETPSGRGETVLLVEDEAAIRRMSQTMLERLGYRVLSAGTPGEAVRLAAEHTTGIHLVITDVVMPGMNGRELADKLHALYPHIRTLFMSGYTADVIAHRGVLEAGVQFLQKPFSFKDLGLKVRAILDRP